MYCYTLISFIKTQKLLMLLYIVGCRQQPHPRVCDINPVWKLTPCALQKIIYSNSNLEPTEGWVVRPFHQPNHHVGDGYSWREKKTPQHDRKWKKGRMGGEMGEIERWSLISARQTLKDSDNPLPLVCFFSSSECSWNIFVTWRMARPFHCFVADKRPLCRSMARYVKIEAMAKE